MEEELRLAKLMAQRGLCSRREAEEYISRGWVEVDGEKITKQGTKVMSNCDIVLSDMASRTQEDKVTIVLYKPLGFVSSQPEPGMTPAITLITPENFDSKSDGPPLKPRNLKNLATAGRLDVNSKGLLIFTQDGRLARKLIGENSDVEKEYLVRVSPRPTEEQMRILRHGLQLDGVQLRRAVVELINDDQIRMILKQGRKRQIRRMCELVGLRVNALKRVRVGDIMLGKLEEGCWRWL